MTLPGSRRLSPPRYSGGVWPRTGCTGLATTGAPTWTWYPKPKPGPSPTTTASAPRDPTLAPGANGQPLTTSMQPAAQASVLLSPSSGPRRRIRRLGLLPPMSLRSVWIFLRFFKNIPFCRRESPTNSTPGDGPSLKIPNRFLVGGQAREVMLLADAENVNCEG
jgi:hypothetical protein